MWGTLPGATDETVVIVAHRDGWFEGANDNGSGIATMLGPRGVFAKSAARRNAAARSCSSAPAGHHDGTAESGTWLSQHPETFAKTALLINCEHTAANQLIRPTTAPFARRTVESPMSGTSAAVPRSSRSSPMPIERLAC